MPSHQRDCQTTGPCTASCGLLINSAGNHPPGGLGTGSAGVHSGFRLGIRESVDGCPPCEAALPPVGLLVSCPPREAAMPPVGHWWLSSMRGSSAPCGPLVVVVPVRQQCPLWAIGGCRPREAAVPPVGLLVSCPPCESSREKLARYLAKVCMPTR